MSLNPDWAPNIHPIVVHFPIALLTAAVVVDLVSLFMRSRAAVRDAATWLYCAGAALAILAYFTGRSGADAMLLPVRVTPLVNQHADWAFRTTWFFTFFASARLAVSYILPPKPLILGAGVRGRDCRSGDADRNSRARRAVGISARARRPGDSRSTRTWKTSSRPRTVECSSVVSATDLYTEAGDAPGWQGAKS